MKLDKRKIYLIQARKVISTAELRKEGLSTSMVNAINKSSNVRPETAGAIAKLLNVDVTEILAD